MNIEDKIQEQLTAERGFWIHFAKYMIVNIALAVFFFSTTPNGYQWFWWVAFGWGIGLSSHAAQVFLVPNLTLDFWEKKRKDVLRRKFSANEFEQRSDNLPFKF